MKPTDRPTIKIVAREALTLRLSKNQNQAEFWSRFGVSQACGSRIECTSHIPKPVFILLKLYLAGRLTDDDLTPLVKIEITK